MLLYFLTFFGGSLLNDSKMNKGKKLLVEERGGYLFILFFGEEVDFLGKHSHCVDIGVRIHDQSDAHLLASLYYNRCSRIVFH